MGNTILVSFRSAFARPVGDPLTRIVHMSTGSVAFRFSQAVVVVVDRAERDRAVAHCPSGSIILAKADRLADQCLPDVDRLAMPSDLAVVARPSHLMFDVFRLAQDAVEAPRRGRVVIGRRVIAERLVRALFVVDELEVPQAIELLAQAARWRGGSVLQQCQMHPLVAGT